MSEPVVIDKNMFKIMKYIYRRKEVSLETLFNKFDCDTVYVTISYLCEINYAAYKQPNGKFTYETNNLNIYGRIGMTPPGNIYVEERTLSFTKWIIPTLISILALVTSIAALISSFNNEITVFLAQ